MYKSLSFVCRTLMQEKDNGQTKLFIKFACGKC